jgi:hypothetical protein
MLFQLKKKESNGFKIIIKQRFFILREREKRKGKKK